MKTLLLSADDIQNFNKLICDTKPPTQLTGTPVTQHVHVAGGQAAASCNIMALQYYLKSSGGNNYVVTTQQELQLKHPTLHQQHSSSHHHHHHPYFQPQQQQPPPQQITLTPAPAHAIALAQAHNQQQTHSANHTRVQPLPVHALNQNSNFSAASSSTGGTASSHAPTQQSNTTGSSLSPPAAGGATVNARTAAASTATGKSNATTSAGAAAAAGGGNARATLAASARKHKTEPIMSPFHQTERLTFANTHMAWGEDHWKRVVFQDERKFNLDGPDGFSYYFHDLRNYERSLSQRPRGNSVYVYVVVTASGPVHLEISMGKQKPESYIELILRKRDNIAAKLGGSGEFVLQDSWTTSAVPSAQEWLSAEGVKTLKWPLVSHDLNIMENIWGWLVREVYDGGRKFSRKDDLIFRIREAWLRLPADLIANLYSTLPERVSQLYYTRGVYTNC